MKKKGFTLVELLAVIVILAIIALIATPSVLKMIEQARQGAAESSMLSYTSEIEKQIIADTMNTDNMGKNYDGTYSITGKTLTKEDGVTISLDIKGSAPEEGTVTIKNSVVTLAKIKFGKYYVTYTYENKETSYCSSKKEYPTSCDSSTDNSSSDNTTEPEEEPINVAVGDYVQMTPTEKEYTISSASTGCSETTNASSDDKCGEQIINPSELTLWRVIRVNEDDNTYDAVSVYTSSTTVRFYGQTGYQKLVGTLNKIAQQYENASYTVGSRMMGYSKQTETIEVDLTTSNSGTSSTSDTTTETQEKQGAGDTWYQTDTNSVNNVFGNLKANKVGTTTTTEYWLASRYYNYTSSTSYLWFGRYVGSSGNIGGYMLYYYSPNSGSHSLTCAVRPIITLKSELYATGTGTEDDPYVLK